MTRLSTVPKVSLGPSSRSPLTSQCRWISPAPPTDRKSCLETYVCEGWLGSWQRWKTWAMVSFHESDATTWKFTCFNSQIWKNQPLFLKKNWFPHLNMILFGVNLRYSKAQLVLTFWVLLHSAPFVGKKTKLWHTFHHCTSYKTPESRRTTSKWMFSFNGGAQVCCRNVGRSRKCRRVPSCSLKFKTCSVGPDIFGL